MDARIRGPAFTQSALPFENSIKLSNLCIGAHTQDQNASFLSSSPHLISSRATFSFHWPTYCNSESLMHFSYAQITTHLHCTALVPVLVVDGAADEML